MEVKITNVTYSAWKVPYLEIFCSVLPRIQTQHVRSVFLYTVRMWKNMIQKNSEYGHLSRSDTLQKSSKLQKKKKKKKNPTSSFARIALTDTLHLVYKSLWLFMIFLLKISSFRIILVSGSALRNSWQNNCGKISVENSGKITVLIF